MSDIMIHKSAIVDDGASIGKGTKIWHFCHISSGCKIGTNCNLGQNVFVATDAIIGNNVKIQNNVSLYGGVIIEDDVFCGPSMVFTNINTPRSFVSRRGEYTETVIKKGASIGANATIICGHNIGQFALIGAGAVITHDVKDYALMIGNPAKHGGWVCKCGEVLEFKNNHAVCERCNNEYKLSLDRIEPIDSQEK